MIHNAFDWLKSLHNPETFSHWLSSGGLWLVAGIIFAETGLLAGFFLPGDSLLITTGVLTNPANPNAIPGLNILYFHLLLTVVAIVGDQCGYFLGRQAGNSIFDRPDGTFFKKKYVTSAHEFYEKHGVLALIACRFVPVMRTFVPFVAGVGRMPYRKFLIWDIVGGTLWINTLLAIGYYLGQTSLANRLDKVILLVIIVSTLPMIFGAFKQFLKPKQTQGNR
jgi:membrane-associated protein